jgi:4-amino-4-deoxychorismate lyase
MSPKERTLPLLLETIKIEDGEIFNIEYHQKRADYSCQTLYNTADGPDLSKVIDPPQKGLFRCRILYSDKIHSIEYIPYTPKDIHRLKIIPSEIQYDLKYANRDALNELLLAHRDADEIIIEKDGLLTDTTISNIAFYDGRQWYTPATPLLKGTMRAKLIDENFLQTKDIKKDDLHLYTQVALMNAMIGFKVIKGVNILNP